MRRACKKCIFSKLMHAFHPDLPGSLKISNSSYQILERGINAFNSRALRSPFSDMQRVSLNHQIVHCPPCKFFTPELLKTYERLKEAGRNFEVVFVTSDRSTESFHQHAGCMPWLAIPFGDPRLQQITNQFGIDGIPSLVILDEKGSLITMNGRQAIQHDSGGVDFPWYPKPLNELTQMAAVQLNENVCLILFTDGEEEELLEARAVLKGVAAREHQKGEDQELFFFYAGDDEFCDQVRDFANLEDRSPLLVILDSPEQQVYVCPATDMSCEIVTEFVDNYLGGKLTPQPIRHAAQGES